MAINIVEVHHVSPSQGAPKEQLLPLLYFDILWLPVHLMKLLFFYDFHCSQSDFMETVVEDLKNSLSLTLKHYLPLSGKILFPLTSGKPVSHYLSGDSVPLTIAVSSSDFCHLTGNHSRDSDEFHDFIPHIPPPTSQYDIMKFSVLAIQVTLFPNQGFSIGITFHHAICDGANIFDFIYKWASITRFNGDNHLAATDLPFYDRNIVQDANKLTTIDWDHHMKTCIPNFSSAISQPIYKVRRTFSLTDFQIQALKNTAINNRKHDTHVSSFTVICGLVWSCLAMSSSSEDDAAECLSFPADCRSRLKPPLPETYFGNCLIPVRLETSHGKLTGEDGFSVATEAIGEAIKETVKEFRIHDWEGKRSIGKRVVRVALSPRMDPYGADFGWGRPGKFECVHIDFDGAVAMCMSKEGGVEIGLCLPKPEMDAFAHIFNKIVHIKCNL